MAQRRSIGDNRLLSPFTPRHLSVLKLHTLHCCGHILLCISVILHLTLSCSARIYHWITRFPRSQTFLTRRLKISKVFGRTHLASLSTTIFDSDTSYRVDHTEGSRIGVYRLSHSRDYYRDHDQGNNGNVTKRETMRQSCVVRIRVCDSTQHSF